MPSDSTIHNLLSINNDLLVFKRLIRTMKDLQTARITIPNDNATYVRGYRDGAAHTLDLLLTIASRASSDITGEG